MLRAVGRLGTVRVVLHVARFLWDDLAVALALCLLTLNINKEIAGAIAPEVLLPTLGIAISIFTGFRNSQAYARWWEARSLWGALINQSRNWRDNLQAFLGDAPDNQVIKRQLLERQVLMAWTLNHELRDRPNGHAAHGVAALAQGLGVEGVTTQVLLVEQSRTLHRLHGQGKISDFGRIQLQRILDEICNVIGGCEKVRNQAFPVSYDIFIRLCAWVFGFLFYIRMDAAYEPYGWVVGYAVMAGFILFERLGTYIENPFFQASLALPLNRLCATITGSLLGASHPLATPLEGERSVVWT